MSNALPPGKRILTRSFYGFQPQHDGYIGWTEESSRDAFLRKVTTGDIVMIYGATSSHTIKAVRATVLGFLEIEALPVRDFERSSPDSLMRKKKAGWSDSWTYGIAVKRAWAVEERRMIADIAFKSYDPVSGMALAVYGFELDDDEAAEAQKIKVREVSVWGQPGLPEDPQAVRTFSDVFTPSRAFPGTHGARSSNYVDGQAWVYLARFDGDGHALLGRQLPRGSKDVVMKIGVTNDTKRRLDELNSGIPPAAIGKWTIAQRSQPFPDKASAEAVEQQFKDGTAGKLESLGREFFWGSFDVAQSHLISLPGMRRFRG